MNIYMGNPTLSKITSSHFHAWQKAVSTKFPNIQIAWEKNFCRALVDSVPVGFFDQNTKTGMIAKS
jgi:hypothetical protein